jgi:hypothetical protein
MTSSDEHLLDVTGTCLILLFCYSVLEIKILSSHVLGGADLTKSLDTFPKEMWAVM